MYWYYKYPLMLIGLVLIFGLAYLGWRKLPEDVTDNISEKVLMAEEETVVDEGATLPREAPLKDRVISLQSGSPQAGTAEAERRLKAAEDQLALDNYVAARTLAHKVLAAPEIQKFDRMWKRAADVVTKVNSALLNSDIPAPDKVAYIIKSGDSLARIAAAHRTTVGALQRFNNLDPTSSIIYPGNVLYMYDGTWTVEVYKKQFVLLLFKEDLLFKQYPVGIGRHNRTPVGTFKVNNKVRQPAWTPPGRHIPYGDPENVLGTHWMGLQATGNTDGSLRGYGIHGTWEPETVGTAASQGCVRLRNEDVAELFDLIPVETTVVIKDE